jgi:hypothetical protein
MKRVLPSLVLAASMLLGQTAPINTEHEIAGIRVSVSRNPGALNLQIKTANCSTEAFTAFVMIRNRASQEVRQVYETVGTGRCQAAASSIMIPIAVGETVETIIVRELVITGQIALPVSN